MFDCKGKTILITGGSRGLGRDAALKLGARGVDVVITYRSKRAEAEDVVAQITKLGRRAVALPLDVGVSSSFPAFAQTLRATLKQHWQREKLDYLVNNAGIGQHALIVETTEAQFDELMRVHLKGPFFLTQALLPLIIPRRGVITFINSTAGERVHANVSQYAATKHALKAVADTLRLEMRPYQVRVLSVMLGRTATPMQTSSCMGVAVRPSITLSTRT